MRHESAAYLWGAAEAARSVITFLDGVSWDQFTQDAMRRSAVERQLEILGESLNRVRRTDPRIAAQIRDVSRIVGMRNILAHEYGTVDARLVYEAGTRKVPTLLPQIEALLPASSDG
ncbi:DUF86 domain-containing protein [Actinomyces sp. 2119]|uniref:HepT-like ribonuclease domain-containing protein n=1 Tax=Actinomyces sp. 2119 TaxID=2321393 RepID=UPI000E6CB7E0|nr:HepT-like ribonuclease domain-containing protein [Actinomyces sp. 2119]RJF43229.1 DUF86 domain-containing protein [Actinomyces sp. 2119]